MATSRKSIPQTLEQLTFLSEAPPVKVSPLPDSAAAWMTRVATWPLSSVDLLAASAPVGSCGKMFPASSPAKEDAPSGPSSKVCGNAGMRHVGGFLMLNSSEWNHTLVPSPNGGGVCSLSDILEKTGDHLARYCLSPKACAGILRRAEKRGRALPPSLRAVLERVAQTTTKPKQDI